MIKSVLTCCRVVACLLLPAFFNSALALDAPQHDTLTYTHELKPIPQESFQIAKATFLPYIKDSEIGFSGNELKGDYNFTGDCSNKDSLFTSKNCIYPKALVLSSQCPFLPGYYTRCECLSKFSKTSCNSPYILGGESCEGKYEKCVCPAKVELTCPNDTCTKTCDGNCITKSCTPTANQTGCTNGTQACDDGCCGTNRKCCIPCTNKITSKPANSSYTYSSCTDGEGSKQIQTGWVCNPGYHEKNGDCEKDCPIDNCSAYTLASCPTNGNCSTCNKTAQDCSKDTQTKYRLDSCKSGYKISGNSCIKSGVSRACQYVGDILYDDKTCAGVNDTLDSSKTVIGVVFDVNRRLALAFHENTVSRMSWAPAIEKKISNLYFSNFFEAENDFNGKKNTEIILSQTNAFDTPAKYCHNYDPYNRGTWYLPAAGELKLIYNNLSTLNNSLSKVNGELLSNGDYLSSSMYTNYVAWTINFRNGSVIKYSTPMNDPKSYRPVLTF